MCGRLRFGAWVVVPLEGAAGSAAAVPTRVFLLLLSGVYAGVIF